MPRPSKYPPEFRQRNVGAAWESERPITTVVRVLGTHHETPQVWLRDDEGARFGVELICREIAVLTCAYRARRTRPQSARPATGQAHAPAAPTIIYRSAFLRNPTCGGCPTVAQAAPHSRRCQ